MYARMARYKFIGDPRALARRTQESMLPLFQEQPGFVSYSVMSTANEVLSFSIWETEEQAEAANKVSRDWVADNIDPSQIELVESRVGELLVATALGVDAFATT
jgi:Antibiotic biosynthesis monooxygenase